MTAMTPTQRRTPHPRPVSAKGEALRREVDLLRGLLCEAIGPAPEAGTGDLIARIKAAIGAENTSEKSTAGTGQDPTGAVG